jgi:SAM-dependent methyltransferase
MVTMCYDAQYAHQYDLRPVRKMSELRWNFVQSTLGLSAGSRILDVGYGNGAFLKRARDADMAIFGIDLHNEDFGIPVVGFDTNQDYDLVCFFDSLEHLPDFTPVLQLHSRHVVVSIPNTPDFILTTPRKWRHFKPGEHLHYFSRASLDGLMQTWGFPRRLAEGYPEDRLRGKLAIDGESYDNIYTAIYTSC